MRPKAVSVLLESVAQQKRIPDEVIVVDGSTNDLTCEAIEENEFELNIRYFMVTDEDRGLTRQRNYGIERVSEHSDIVAFLDDDTVLEQDYFAEILSTFNDYPDAVGAGGYIIENGWKEGLPPSQSKRYYSYDGWYRRDSQRTVLRKYLGLGPSSSPCIMPPEANARPVSGFPPSGKTYPAEYYMGGAMSFRRCALQSVAFSKYFEGYGLYEDLDFCLRLSKLGSSYVNTAARLHHYHDPDGRPNWFKYGKMVVRNGWYVWRVKYEKPVFQARWKWWFITLLLATIRLMNVVSGPRRMQALTEALGRYYAMLTVFVFPPQIER